MCVLVSKLNLFISSGVSYSVVHVENIANQNEVIQVSLKEFT